MILTNLTNWANVICDVSWMAMPSRTILSTVFRATVKSCGRLDSGPPPPDFLLALAAALVGELRLPLAELAGDLVQHDIERRVKLGGGFFGIDIRAGDGEVDLDRESVGRFGGFIVDENDMRGDDLVAEFLEVLDFFGDVAVDRGGEPHIAGTEMELHNRNHLPSSGRRWQRFSGLM